jgi:hypothetical protein
MLLVRGALEPHTQYLLAPRASARALGSVESPGLKKI